MTTTLGKTAMKNQLFQRLQRGLAKAGGRKCGTQKTTTSRRTPSENVDVHPILGHEEEVRPRGRPIEATKSRPELVRNSEERQHSSPIDEGKLAYK